MRRQRSRQRELHENVVQFTLARPDLSEIDNIEAYLSQMRLAANNRLNQLSICEYDSAEIGLRAIYSNSDELIQAQHELREVCRYACAQSNLHRRRRFDSKIFSRLFSERNRSHLKNQSPCRGRTVTRRPAHFAFRKEDFWTELRRFIFAARAGNCLEPAAIAAIYDSEEPPKTLALGNQGRYRQRDDVFALGR